MSTQYDALETPYSLHRSRSKPAFLEKECVRETLNPLIRNARVLELACGSGFYTYDLLQWGASHVVGVDISAEMINAAKRLPVYEQKRSHVDFVVADCSKAEKYPGGPFDLCMAAWLVNYAPDRKSMSQMFANVALNLKPGGTFVTVTLPPASDPEAPLANGNKLNPIEGYKGHKEFNVELLDEVEDGVEVRVNVSNEAGIVTFDCYHLRKEVHAAAAREGGLTGRLEWKSLRMPENFGKAKLPHGKDEIVMKNGTPVFNFGILSVSKKD